MSTPRQVSSDISDNSVQDHRQSADKESVDRNAAHLGREMTPPRLAGWMFQFCNWHEQFKAGTLGVNLVPAYMQARLDLNAILVLAQGLDIRAGNGIRQAVRIARGVPVEFDMVGGKVSSLTQDLSTSGISAILGDAPAVGTLCGFRLKLARDIQPIIGQCRVVAKIPMQGSVRMAVTFIDLTKEGLGHIETLVFDAACADIRRMLRCGKPEERPATPAPVPSPPLPGP